MKWIGFCLFLSLAVGLLSACSPAPSAGDVEQPAMTEASDAAPTPRQGVVSVPTEASSGSQPVEAAPLQPGDYDAAATPLVQQAQEDLAQRLSVPVDQISVTSVSEVVWPDGSLGCAQPGQAYTQATVPGYQIVLSYQGQAYDYHTDARHAFLCENTAQSTGFVKKIAPEVKLINLAISDLAQRLGIPRNQILPEPIDPKKWTDTSLGCPQAGQTYNPGDITGYEITLKVKDQNNQEVKYIYHSDLERVVFCETP
jgi:hypothetical protein